MAIRGEITQNYALRGQLNQPLSHGNGIDPTASL